MLRMCVFIFRIHYNTQAATYRKYIVFNGIIAVCGFIVDCFQHDLPELWVWNIENFCYLFLDMVVRLAAKIVNQCTIQIKYNGL